MVDTDTFMPLRLEEVAWREEGILYRGCVEGDISERLYNTCQNLSPSYFGIYSRYPTEEKFTWTRLTLESVLYYPIQRTIERAKMASMWPWNRPVHPLIMKINAKPYRNNLGISKTDGERDGIVVRGDIALEDIEILYSSKVCKIDKKMRERIADDIKRQAQQWYSNEEYDPTNYFQSRGFLEEFKDDPRLKGMFLSIKFTDGTGNHQFTEDELQSFDRFISGLRRITPAPQ